MTTKHFDVIVLGRSIGALTAAALLARRDFTVLVLGQGERAASYRLDKRTLLRRGFTLLAATTPTWRKVVVELAQSQTWKRRVEAASPMMQILAPRRRLEVPPDMALLGREIDREYPELRRLVDAARQNKPSPPTCQATGSGPNDVAAPWPSTHPETAFPP